MPCFPFELLVFKIFPLFSLNSSSIRRFGEQGIWSVYISMLLSSGCLCWWAQGAIIFLEKDRHKQKFHYCCALTSITFPYFLFLMSVEQPFSCNKNTLEGLRSVRVLRDFCALQDSGSYVQDGIFFIFSELCISVTRLALLIDTT